ncbi:MAG: carbohydrate ABC transporter permease [Provencibacterium sp.]|nr:carbohydrate ABC transporter permease [Provencibacterium sp.]
MARFNLKKFSLFNCLNAVLLTLLSVLTLYPFWYVIMASLTTDTEAARDIFFLLPVKPSLSAYKMVFSTSSILTAYRNTLFVTTVGTALSLVLTALTAYPLSRRRLRGGKILTLLIYFTMLFSGGMIPTFLVVKSLGLYDSLWALILPKAVTVYNLLLMLSFFKSIPESLEESASIEGANDLMILFQIIIPLSMPIFATMILFYAVAYWNAWFDAVLYISKSTRYPLQLVLREIVQQVDLSYVGGGGSDVTMSDMTIQSVRMATIVVAILPIMVVYPFLQKYFVKGVMIGAVKA